MLRQKWYFKYLVEQVNWKKISSEQANLDIDAGHDVHDKTIETTHHFELGRHLTDDLNVFVDFSYVIRDAVEIEDADNLGVKQTSKGIGDMQVLGDYRVWHNTNNAVSLAGGIKFPTGSTHEHNLQGERFETDMQPGSGAFNYIIGGIYKWQKDQWSVTANATYVITTQGAQHFQYGDLLTTTLYGEYVFNPHANNFKTHLGLDTIYQEETKEKQNGEKNPDMGGQTVFMGPVLHVDANQNLGITGSFLFPISQNLNGLAQKIDFQWTLGGQIKW